MTCSIMSYFTRSLRVELVLVAVNVHAIGDRVCRFHHLLDVLRSGRAESAVSRRINIDDDRKVFAESFLQRFDFGDYRLGVRESRRG